MKAPQFYITLALGALCLVLSTGSMLLAIFNSNLKSDIKLQKQQLPALQAKINLGNSLKNLQSDLINLARENEKVRQALANNGVSVSAPSSAIPTPTATPASSPAANPASSPIK